MSSSPSRAGTRRRQPSDRPGPVAPAQPAAWPPAAALAAGLRRASWFCDPACADKPPRRCPGARDCTTRLDPDCISARPQLAVARCRAQRAGRFRRRRHPPSLALGGFCSGSRARGRARSSMRQAKRNQGPVFSCPTWPRACGGSIRRPAPGCACGAQVPHHQAPPPAGRLALSQMTPSSRLGLPSRHRTAWPPWQRRRSPCADPSLMRRPRPCVRAQRSPNCKAYAHACCVCALAALQIRLVPYHEHSSMAQPQPNTARHRVQHASPHHQLRAGLCAAAGGPNGQGPQHVWRRRCRRDVLGPFRGPPARCKARRGLRLPSGQ